MTGRYVSFTIAASRCCVSVEQVMQIIRPEDLHDVPRTPAFVEGAINLHGEIIPVIDLKKRLGLPARSHDGDPRKRRVIIVRFGQRFYGLDVDEVREIVEVEQSDLQEDTAGLLGERAQFVSAVAHREEDVFLVLDLGKILDAGRTVQVEAG